MRFLVSAIALAVALAWPGAGDAQTRTSTERAKTTTKQVTKQQATKQYVQRPAKVAKRSAGEERCARRMWWGCTGWDPDPNIRDMLARDVGDDN